MHVTQHSSHVIYSLTQVCGQHVMPSALTTKRTVVGYDNATVCLETIMHQCYSHITDAAMDHMFNQAPEVIHTIRADGCVKDSFLDELQISKLEGDLHINRDSLVTWRQHAHVMSHTSSKAKFVDYLLMRDERNNPVLQQQRKLQEQAAKLIQRAAAANAKAELAAREKASRLLEKVADKERRDALTTAERKAEDKQKKIENAGRKAAKTLLALGRLRAAQEIAAGIAAPLANAAANDEVNA
jgi:hypothetical protein